jgi:hypothetical protein
MHCLCGSFVCSGPVKNLSIAGGQAGQVCGCGGKGSRVFVFVCVI